MTDKGEDGGAQPPKIKQGDTITLDELVRRMRDAAFKMGKKNPNRLLLFNAAASLVALGIKVEELDAKLAEQTSRPKLVGPGGQRVN